MQATLRPFLAVLLLTLQMGAFAQQATKPPEIRRSMLAPALTKQAPTAVKVPNRIARLPANLDFCIGKPQSNYCDPNGVTLHQCYDNQDSPRLCYEGCIVTDKIHHCDEKTTSATEAQAR